MRLIAAGVAAPASWRFLLTDDSGALLAEHAVSFDAVSWQARAFADLSGYLSWQVGPDRLGERRAAQIVGELGAWIAEVVLGGLVPVLVRAAPVAVRVEVPDGAQWLLMRPWELARADGGLLAVRGVTFVMQPPGTPADRPAGAVVTGRLRVLGLFSMPGSDRPLALRRERVALVSQIDRTGKAADVRVLQYGVTRERLTGLLAEPDGWDIVHLSGHGAPGELLLETADGSPDPVSAADLAGLLAAARGRVRLVTLASCGSAADATAGQRRLLGLPAPRLSSSAEPPSARQAAALATELSRRLDCAVLAMRYPVADEFAIRFSGRVYELLAASGEPLPRAVGSALASLSAGGDGGTFAALSYGTPALFGPNAAGLAFSVPDRGPEGAVGVAGPLASRFPAAPERFVGRTEVMARASAALAADSGSPGVVLHGIPGGGKTACAVELAHCLAHAFDHVIWFKVPDEGTETGGALTDLALTLDPYLDDRHLSPVVADTGQLASYLPVLTRLMERERILLVIDNAESLLGATGEWADSRWAMVAGALAAHAGRGRLILTSRRAPSALTASRLITEPVGVLTLNEALILAAELPNLGALGRGEIPGISARIARKLLGEVLEISHGLPKLLELADGQAADRDRLTALVTTARQALGVRGGWPGGFLTEEPGTVRTDDYLTVLRSWTRVVAGTLPEATRDLFCLLCCLEEPDRERPVVAGIWAGLCRNTAVAGPAGDLNSMLASITASGLADSRAPYGRAAVRYAIHPVAAAAGRQLATDQFRDLADVAAAEYWDAAYRRASGHADQAGADGAVDTGQVVRAGLAAVSYLVRRGRWAPAAAMVYEAIIRAPTRANAAALRPAIERIAEAEPVHQSVLARVLQELDPAVAEEKMRTSMEAAVARRDYQAASVTATQLIGRSLHGGRLDQALRYAQEALEYTRLNGSGPWTQLFDECMRLQVLTRLGEAETVLREVGELRARMDTLPARAGPDDATMNPWNARETLFSVGRDAAERLGRWDEALAMNAEVVASKRGRAAPAAAVAISRFNDYQPLLGLGRGEEARQLLRDCRECFQEAGNHRMLGRTMGALASVEKAAGQPEAAIRLEHQALAYKYLANDIRGIADSYEHLGDYVGRPRALACHLAAALIRALASPGAPRSLRRVAAALADGGSDRPAGLAGLAHQLGDIPRTNLAGLIATLPATLDEADLTLRNLIDQAAGLAGPRDRGPDVS